MRVTQLGTLRTLLDGLQAVAERLQRSQRALTTGRRVRVPSDDPAAMAVAMAARAELARLQQQRRNLRQARTWLVATESALQGMEEVLMRAHEVALQGMDDGTTAEGRSALAQLVGSLLEEAVGLGNARLRDRCYLFGGFQALEEPFRLEDDGSVTYRGDDGEISLPLGPDLFVINLPGQRAFLDTGAFDALRQLRDALEADDREAIRAAALAVERALDALEALQGHLGGRSELLDHLEARLDDREVLLEGVRSAHQDADYARASVEYHQHLLSYRVILQAIRGSLRGDVLSLLA